MKLRFFVTTILILSFWVSATAQYKPAPPQRFDFKALHKDTLYINITGPAYTAGAARRFDFQALHKDTLHLNLTGLPYVSGVPQRFDFEAPHRQIIHKE